MDLASFWLNNAYDKIGVSLTFPNARNILNPWPESMGDLNLALQSEPVVHFHSYPLFFRTSLKDEIGEMEMVIVVSTRIKSHWLLLKSLQNNNYEKSTCPYLVRAIQTRTHVSENYLIIIRMLQILFHGKFFFSVLLVHWNDYIT